ncbi:MAG: FKBP-type peptidyl-prolyl cis-trans isomerase, partial [Polyangia bacterium]
IARMGLLPAFLLGSLASVGCHRLCSVISSSAPKTENEKVFYALGMDIGKSVDVFSLSPSELEMVKAGLTDAVTKRPSKIDFDKTRPKIREMVQQRKQVRIDAEKAKGKNFLAKAAKESGATVLPSGVVFRTVRSGTGASPVATDTVKVNYEGHLIDGTVFDSSYKKNQPAEFFLQRVVRCWTEGIPRMKVGEKAQLTCPPDMGYGDRGNGTNIPAGATLIFDVELLEIVAHAPPAPAGSAPRPAPLTKP